MSWITRVIVALSHNQHHILKWVHDPTIQARKTDPPAAPHFGPTDIPTHPIFDEAINALVEGNVTPDMRARLSSLLKESVKEGVSENTRRLRGELAAERAAAKLWRDRASRLATCLVRES